MLVLKQSGEEPKKIITPNLVTAKGLPFKDRPFFIAVFGPSGSGKSSIVDGLTSVHGKICTVVGMDCYYKDTSNLSASERLKLNFDEPQSLCKSAIAEDFHNFVAGDPVYVREYNFNTQEHIITQNTYEPQNGIVIYEGIFTGYFAAQGIIKPDLIFYIDVDQDECLRRRIARDRSRNPDYNEQHTLKVWPNVQKGFKEYVEPYAELFKKQNRLIVIENGADADLMLNQHLFQQKITDVLQLQGFI